MMRLPVSFRWMGVALVLGIATSATAQPAGTSAPATPPSPTGAGADAQLGFERKAQLSGHDELVQSDAIISRMDQASGNVRRQLEAARGVRDVVKSLCLNDKLSQIDVAARSARDRQSALQSAVQRGDTELANHEFTILTVLRQRTEQLGAEANQCIGQDLAFVGQTEIVVDNNMNLPPPDETDYGGNTPPPGGGTGGEGTGTEPPPCASCTGL